MAAMSYGWGGFGDDLHLLYCITDPHLRLAVRNTKRVPELSLRGVAGGDDVAIRTPVGTM